MANAPDLSTLSSPRKLLLGSGALLLISSFLPWYHWSAGPFSASMSGWHQLGTLVWLVLIATLIWEGVRIAGVAPVQGKQGDLVTAAGGGVVLVLGVIFVIVRLSDGRLGFGFWLGVILMIVFAVATFQVFQAAGGQAAVQQIQSQAAERRAQQAPTTPPSAPPATPPATPPTQQQQPPQDPPAGT